MNSKGSFLTGLAFVFTASAFAKCDEATIHATLISNGAQLPLPFSGLYFTNETCGLPPGDSILISVSFDATSTCMGTPSYIIYRNASTVYNASGTMTYQYYVTQPGTYYMRAAWGDGYNEVWLNVTSGWSVSLTMQALLEGPFDPVALTMRNDLYAHTLLPTTEPYTALGLTLPGSGGQTIGSPAASDNVDWVLVELRDAIDPATVVATVPALLTRNGRLIAAAGNTHVELPAMPGVYYVALRHRNHLGVMTATPIELSTGLTSIDLTNPSTATYGTDARKIVGSKALLWAGNSKREDGVQQIRYMGSNNDRDPILARVGGSVPTATTAGYFEEDIDLDGTVKYTGPNNDRDIILVDIGGSVPTAVRVEQLP